MATESVLESTYMDDILDSVAHQEIGIKLYVKNYKKYLRQFWKRITQKKLI